MSAHNTNPSPTTQTQPGVPPVPPEALHQAGLQDDILHVDLTGYARQGFAQHMSGDVAASACPYCTCCAAGMAWLAGAWLRDHHYPEPTKVHMSHGYTICADGLLLAVYQASAIRRLS